MKIVIKSKRLLKKMADRNECYISLYARDVLNGDYHFYAGCMYNTEYSGDCDYDLGYYVHKRFVSKVIRG